MLAKPGAALPAFQMPERQPMPLHQQQRSS
jgi:hypothetical protein